MTGKFYRGIPKVALGSASILAAVYMGLSPRLAKKLYSNMIFHPYPYPEGNYHIDNVGGYKYKDVFFASYDGTLLHGWFFEQDGSTETVLLSHGNTGNVSGRPLLLEALLKTGASLFIYDYRGYGRSQGKPSIQGIVEDGCAAFDYLVSKQGLAEQKVVLYGESLGCAVSCQIVKHKEAHGIILQSGFASLPKIGREHVPLMNLYPSILFPQPLLDSVAVLRLPHPPLLVVHGVKDAVVPIHHGKELFAQACGKKTFVAFEANHSDIPLVAPEKFVAVLNSFLQGLGSTE